MKTALAKDFFNLVSASLIGSYLSSAGLNWLVSAFIGALISVVASLLLIFMSKK